MKLIVLVGVVVLGSSMALADLNECIDKCMTVVETAVKAVDANMDDLDSPTLLIAHYSQANMDAICSNYAMAKTDCLSKCDGFDASVNTAPLEYICGAGKQAVQASAACFTKVTAQAEVSKDADGDVVSKCITACMSETQIFAQLLSKPGQLEPAMLAGTTCGVMKCTRDCGLGEIREKCDAGETGPALDTLKLFVAANAKAGIAQMLEPGQAVPERCQKLLGQGGNMDKLKMKVLNKQLEVLSKTEKKLALEMKTLQMKLDKGV